MNYTVKSAGNGLSQKNITIEITRASHTLTVEGEVLVFDAKDGGLDYEVSDWEITELNGETCNHAAVWESMKTLHGDNFTTVFGADIDSALVEVASSMVTAKTPQNAPEIATANFDSMSMEERIERVDWEAVRQAFERNYDFGHGMQEALDDADLNDNIDVEIRSSYGRDFTIETEVDTYQIARSVAETMASNVYDFCEEMMTRKPNVIAA